MFNRNLLIALAASGAVSLSLPTFAQNGCAGVYLGGQLGWGNASYKDHHSHSSYIEEPYTLRADTDHHHNSNHQDGFAGRVYLGYQLNQYLGLETGFAGLSSEEVSEHRHFYTPGNSTARDVESDDDWKVRTSVWDLLLRVGTPFGDSGFRGDVKVGAAAIFVSHDEHHDHRIVVRGGHDDHHDHDTQFGPAAGAGLSYNFSHNVAMDVSYLHVFGNLNDSHHDHENSPNIDMVTLGVSYLFIR